MIQIKIALVIDIIICFPYIAKQIWNFILPALYTHERKSLKTILLISCALFASGMCFSLFVILPLIINFGLSFATENIQAMLRISDIINLVLWMSIVFGLMFQIPVLTYYLIKTDVISYETIADKRSYVVVLLLILSALLTPPDIISQLILSVPTYLLFEAGLLVSKFKRKKIQ
jgi:sec-independent protein translocase protein TatC